MFFLLVLLSNAVMALCVRSAGHYVTQREWLILFGAALAIAALVALTGTFILEDF